eukprot:TRINITY_DN2509_c0_g1_i1.p1 TRINITY_DN2509_c0_g1~~TRINITY_DN2509_c0_g1_i1.p1  ORF type:complete len:534 (+),score=207.22 TRINITY_DN2509_c0_g1_i1:86-1603(+)
MRVQAGRNRGRGFAAAVLLAAAALLPGGEARLSGGKYHIARTVGGTDTSDADGDDVVYLGTFGFTANGVCTAVVRGDLPAHGPNGSTPAGAPLQLRSGLFMEPVTSINSARTARRSTEELGLCGGAAPSAGILPMELRRKGDGVWGGEVHTTAAGFHALYFYNCRRSDIRIAIEIQQFNLVNEERRYLQVGDWPLPVIFLCFFFIYAAALAFWGHVMQSNKEHLHKIHFLMIALLGLKCGTMLFESLKYHAFAETGTGSTWNMFFHLFLMLKGITLFVAIMLLGSGWSFLKPHLAERDKQILMLVVPLQVGVNVCDIAIDETTEGDPTWTTWQNALRVADIICCCVVLLPIVWSVKGLIQASQSDGKVARSLVRLRQFRTFYLLVVCYIYFSRVLVSLLETALPFQLTFVGPLTLEAGTLFCYLFVGRKFRPMSQNPYLALQEDDWDTDAGGARLAAEVRQVKIEMAERGEGAAAASPSPKAAAAPPAQRQAGGPPPPRQSLYEF